MRNERIEDEFSHIPNRWKRLRRRRKRDGLCVGCGKLNTTGLTRCFKCGLKNAARAMKAWKAKHGGAL